MIEGRAWRRWIGCGILSTLLVPGLAQAEEGAEVVVLDPPAGVGAAFPALATESATTLRRGHDVLLTWLEPGASGLRLRFARLTLDGWSVPVTIAEGVNRPTANDIPSLTVLDTQAVRRTLLARTGEVMARSGNAGRTWSRLPFSQPLDRASFADGDEGGYVFWQRLDPATGANLLLGTRILAGESLLDDSILPGHSTAAAMTWDGPIVVYRDVPEERVAAVRREAARWLEPGTVAVTSGDAPSLGGAPRVAVHQRKVVVAWLEGATGSGKGTLLKVAFSDDAARTFHPPQEAAKSAEALDVEMDDNGDALLLWRHREGDEAVLSLARRTAEGHRGAPLPLARGPADSFTGPPQIVRAGPRFAATWTEGDPARLRLTVTPREALPAVAAFPPLPSAPPPYRGRGRVGEEAPDLPVQTLGGAAISLAHLRGQAVLLNLWATWCLPCLGEMPELAALHQRYRVAGLTVVGVSIDSADSLDKVHAYVEERGLPFPIWLDPTATIQDALKVRSLPATFIIDRQGRIVLRRDGVLTAEDPEVVRAIDRALGGT